MLLSALAGFAGAFYSGSLLVGVFAGMIAGGLVAAVHAFWCISLSANQVASGLALVIFSTGLADFVGQNIGPEGTTLVGLAGPQITALCRTGPVLTADCRRILLSSGMRSHTCFICSCP